MSKKTASSFLPSKYQSIGRPKINEPVKAAEKTKSESIIIGIRTVFGESKNLET